MDSLSNDIYSYYLDRFSNLPLDKQMHFALRLYSWREDTASQKLLENLKPTVFWTGDYIQLIESIYQGQLFEIKEGSLNTLSIRTPYFAKYPALRRISATLYWLASLQNHYGIDLRPALYSVISQDELQTLRERLWTDKEALAILSTHALNFIYLYDSYLLESALPDPNYLFDIVRDNTYDGISEPAQLQLRLYFLTHCIIGASKFYQQALPSTQLPVYGQMAAELETFIGQNFDAIKLDNKFEFLVCCKLTGQTTLLQGKIVREAEQSISPDGTYLIDRHNMNLQPAYTTLATSEHRNVLYIMADSPPVSRLAPPKD